MSKLSLAAASSFPDRVWFSTARRSLLVVRTIHRELPWHSPLGRAGGLHSPLVIFFAFLLKFLLPRREIGNPPLNHGAFYIYPIFWGRYCTYDRTLDQRHN